MEFPTRIHSSAQFDLSVLRLRQHHGETGNGLQSRRDFLCRIYYLLGWLVGDAGKGFTREESFKARVEIGLCKGHAENLLGQYVIGCLERLGVQGNRIGDGPLSLSEPHGAYRWQSRYSWIVAWLHTACLGLKWNQRTTRDPVRMGWILHANPDCLTWFMRGIADSDGSVNVRNRGVVITSSPNTDLFFSIFHTLGIKADKWFSYRVGYVGISAIEAYRLRIFNPHVMTHKGLLLRRLATARTYASHWPIWLQAEVIQLLRDGRDCASVRDILLSQYGTYVKLKTLKSKRRMLELAGAEL